MNTIDSLRFCKESTTLNGILAPVDLPRFAAEVLQGSDFQVVWQALGESPDRLNLSLQTQVQMRCQRCLSSMTEVIDMNYPFRFVKDEATAQAQDEVSDELDHLVHHKHFELLELIEDELLMALPLVSLHEFCPNAGAIAHLPKEEKVNPFAILQNMA